MDTIFDSKISDAPLPRRSPVRFVVGLVFAAIYWPLAAIWVLPISAISRVFLNPEERLALGQRTLRRIFGCFLSRLEDLGIIAVSDDELRQLDGVSGPLIIACNHPALWDALLVIRRIGRVSGIMKADVLLNPLLGTGARFAGFLPNVPRLKMIREGVTRLDSGGRLLLFPEGTRTREECGLINEFRPGLALLAKQSGAPVLPVFITSNSRYLQKGWPIWRMPDLPVSILLRTGNAVRIRRDERVRDFSRRLEELFKTELG